MATLSFNNVGIRAVSACVPKKVFHNRDLGYLLPEEEVEKTVKLIGINERRIADDDCTASDLCYKAACQLMEQNDIDPSSIDMLLFMSQTSDYRIPATSPILQHRLGLPKRCACLDLTLGCSGYVYALSTAFAYASVPGVERVLLLDGETFSKIVNRRDKVDWPLYGDAGTATLVEKGNFGKSTFALYADGKGEDAVKIHAGMRYPVTAYSLEERMRDDDCVRSDMEVYMDGMEVFNFAMSVVPKGVKEICSVGDSSMEDIDYLVFHQANKFMTDFFVKKLKFNPEKVLYCIERFGNTSSASIPLTLSAELGNSIVNDKLVAMSGFGAGLSWGTALLRLDKCKITKPIDY